MKKQNKKQRAGGSKGAARARASTGGENAADLQKRATLFNIRNSAIALVALGGGGLFAYRSVTASIAEHDLTRIGKGKPSIVQIHDPTCPICNTLQKEVRQALGTIDEDTVTYLVANIRTEDGQRFAARHGVPHVTLLLFDSDGTLQTTLSGPRDSEELSIAFSLLIDPDG
ncbi:MAG: thioredoxin family protein [Pseudomonadota bacterium]